MDRSPSLHRDRPPGFETLRLPSGDSPALPIPLDQETSRTWQGGVKLTCNRLTRLQIEIIEITWMPFRRGLFICRYDPCRVLNRFVR
jgi:hypothetical protein